jgi:L-amino acid ligase
VLEIWRSVKRSVEGTRIYDFQDLRSSDDGDYTVVRDYVLRVLDAIDLRWGPTHTEVILTHDGPRLVEVGARLAGSISPSTSLLATGQNQIVSTVRAFLDPEGFLAETPQPLPLRRHCRGVSLISPRTGILARDLDWRRFERLSSFHGLRRLVAEGDRLPRTTDLFSRPGGLYLVHEDADVIERDYHEIRRWEVDDLYAPLVAS